MSDEIEKELKEDILSELREVSRSDHHTHDVAESIDPKREAEEFKRQRDEEREHGHPAWEGPDE